MSEPDLGDNLLVGNNDSEDDSEDSDYDGDNCDDSDDDEVSSEDDDIFANLGESRNAFDHQIIPTKDPTIINEIDFTEFDEDAPDLDDQLRSLHGSDSDSYVPSAQFNTRNNNLALGMHFRDAKAFRKALKALAIENGHPYVLKRNGTTAVHATCEKKGCKFKIRASIVRDTSTFRVKSFIPNPNHTCPRNYNQKLVNVDYMTTRCLEDLRDDNNLRVTAMKRKIKRDLGYEVSLRKCYRAKSAGISVLCGKEKEQYRRLYDYAETVRVTNPGSMVRFKTVNKRRGTNVQNSPPKRVGRPRKFTNNASSSQQHEHGSSNASQHSTTQNASTSVGRGRGGGRGRGRGRTLLTIPQNASTGTFSGNLGN